MGLCFLLLTFPSVSSLPQVNLCVCVCVHACVRVCVCVCACMRACMSAHRYVHIYMGVGWGAMLDDKLASVNIACFDVSCFSSITKYTCLALA